MHLKKVWAESFDAFILPTGILFFQPTSESSSSCGSRATVAKDVKGTDLYHHMCPMEVGFAITAFNPADPSYPQNLSAEDNLHRNSLLITDIQDIVSRFGGFGAVQVYPSYGFDC